MGHFDAPFLDKNSERYMHSRKISQLLHVLKTQYFVVDNIPTGDFFQRDGQYSFADRAKGEWKPFASKTDEWGYPECYCWFKQTVKIPERFRGETVIYRVNPYYSSSDWHCTNPQLIVWVNGRLVQGMDSNHPFVTVAEKAAGGEELEIYINAHADAREFKRPLMMKAELQVLDKEAVRIYYDMETPLEVANTYDGDTNVRVNLINALNTAADMLDLDSGDRDSFHKSAKEASDYLSKTVYGKKDEETAWCIGHTHIDVAWLWRLRQTREKAARSFATVLKLMDEYPEYKFMSPQAQLYDYVKQDYPEIFEGIKEKVREGRWEAEGSMWVEADTNVTSGESLVRQFLVGQKFFRDELGVENEIMWLPDVFGYSAALPQIIKKSGLKYFMTTKISWNEYNKFPFDTFKWRGIDGTEVLAHFPPIREPSKDEHEDFGTTYNSVLATREIIGGYQRYSQKDLGKNYLCTFGHGDGGGGPTAEMLENGRRMARGIEGCPVVKVAPAHEFFEQLEKDVSGKKLLPVWCGELYLEFHRGTLTSQARNKKYNRRSECLYHDAETLGAIALTECGSAYPKQKLDDNWKLILLNQFHDILPGSAIKEVYEDSKVQYESVLKAGREMTALSQNEIVSKIGLDGNSIVVFNTTGFERFDAIEAEIPEGEFSLFAPDGTEVPYQKTYDGKLVFVAVLPAKGYAVFSVAPKKAAAFPDLEADLAHAETPYFSVSFGADGNIAKLIHKQTGRSVSPDGSPVGKVIAYQDRPHHNEAWDIKCYFDEKSWELDFKNAELIEKGPVRAVYKVVRSFRSSVWTEYYFVYSALERIDVLYCTDWKEDHVVLKADYPVDVNAVKATFDIQFGNLERSTTRNTTWEFAQFEESMHKWVDLSDNSFGLSILNDCKYGCDVKDGHIRPTLLRCATDPNTVQDREYHEFRLSIYPHAGTVASSDVVRNGYDLNYPAASVNEGAHPGTLPKTYSFASADESNIVIETIKKAEDSDDIIVRAFETWNRRTPCKLRFADEIESASECNLMERNDVPAHFENNTIETVFDPFEIKTFKIRFKK